MVTRFWMIVRALGDLTAILSFFILTMFAALALEALRNPDAELFPSPLEYLDAQKNAMGEPYYVPVQKSYCPGDTVEWVTNAYTQRSAAVKVSYYLQSVHSYAFIGPQAAQLEAKYPGKKLEVVSLYRADGPAFHPRQGTFIGGERQFIVPSAMELAEGAVLRAGAPLRLYVEIDAPFSRSAGYYLDFYLGKNCSGTGP